MQQTLSEPSAYQEYPSSRVKRPTLMKRPQFLFIIVLVLLDIGSIWLAYYLAYGLVWRSLDNPTAELSPFWTETWLLPAVLMVILIISFFTQRMYQRRRPTSHLDELFKIFIFTLFATLLTVAVLELSTRLDYHRWLLLYGTLLTIGFLPLQRSGLQWCEPQSRRMM